MVRVRQLVTGSGRRCCCCVLLYCSCSVSLFNLEIEMDFVVPLKDVSVPEKKQAKFQCTITKDVCKVLWYRGGDIITPDHKFDIIDDGKKHMLIINCCEFDDEDDYRIEVLDKTCTARLTVEGKCGTSVTGPPTGAQGSNSLFWLFPLSN